MPETVLAWRVNLPPELDAIISAAREVGVGAPAGLAGTIGRVVRQREP
jgi:hypothetical protein